MRPPGGVVAAMAGISTQVGDESLTVTGARLQFSGRDFDEVIWRVFPDETLTVDIDYFKEMHLQENSIADAVAHLRSGLDRLVLERAEVVDG